MTIALKNPTRQPASYTLTLDCVTPELPATTGIRMKTVYAESYPHKPSMIPETVKFPPTITLSARETIRGLPDAVMFAPEIANAVAAKMLVVVPEAVAANAVYKRPSADPDASQVHVKGVTTPDPATVLNVPETGHGAEGTGPATRNAKSSAAAPNASAKGR